MNSLIGIWLYTSLIYNGNPIPRPDSDLQMYFTFVNESENEIFYYRKSQQGFCKRVASYRVEQSRLIQKITSVDPKNADFCAEDPDMQLGRESISEFTTNDDTLFLHLPLGDETLTFVWTKTMSERL